MAQKVTREGNKIHIEADLEVPEGFNFGNDGSSLLASFLEGMEVALRDPASSQRLISDFMSRAPADVMNSFHNSVSDALKIVQQVNSPEYEALTTTAGDAFKKPLVN